MSGLTKNEHLASYAYMLICLYAY
ncbi:hypothetical protein G768_05086, partial [Escherichia coli HVH 107 (4-5860571)]